MLWLTLAAFADDLDHDGWTPTEGDCDDSDASIHPTAPEICDGLDQDCDDVPDWPMTLREIYFDYDGDGFGCCVTDFTDETTGCCVPLRGCQTSPDGSWYQVVPESKLSFLNTFVAENALDCNDAVGTAYPGGLEVCDTYDNDCDDRTDEDVISEASGGQYFDGDQDGYGGVSIWYGCDPFPPMGVVEQGGDCDDGDPAVHPGAVEHCDGVDEDCQGDGDDFAVDEVSWYLDRDGDGLGDPDTETTGCYPPPLATENRDDTDDAVDGGGGCGCRGARPAPAVVLVLLLPALRPRRRR